MLLEYIEYARRQPKGVKQRIVWVWSLVLTGCIVLVWLSVIIGRQYAEDGDAVGNSVDVPTAPADTASQFKASNQFLNTSQTPPTDFSAVFDAPSATSSSTTSPTSFFGEETGSAPASSTPELWP